MAKYEVTESFDYVPKPGVVRAFIAGEVYDDMPQNAVAKGKDLNALKPVK